MWHFIGVALQTVALTVLVGAGVGVGYFSVKVGEHEKSNVLHLERTGAQGSLIQVRI
jgi:P pilus assembly chaperone PapD